MSDTPANRLNDREMPPLDAVVGQFTARLQDALVELREATTPPLVVKRAFKEPVVLAPEILTVARAVRSSEEPAVEVGGDIDLYDERGMPVIHEFPVGPIGRFQLWTVNKPLLYKPARWWYRRFSDGPHVGAPRN